MLKGRQQGLTIHPLNPTRCRNEGGSSAVLHRQETVVPSGVQAVRVDMRLQARHRMLCSIPWNLVKSLRPELLTVKSHTLRKVFNLHALFLLK